MPNPTDEAKIDDLLNHLVIGTNPLNLQDVPERVVEVWKDGVEIPAKQAIQALITAARVNELEELLDDTEHGHFKGDGINADATIVFAFKLVDRIKELQSTPTNDKIGGEQ